MDYGYREKTQELSLNDIADSYFLRYDIEHFFRFGKQKLLLTCFQTPEVRHEENWWWLCLMGYMMLYQTRGLANQIRYPWEKKQKEDKNEECKTPSRVQRDYERIIKEIGNVQDSQTSRKIKRKSKRIANFRPKNSSLFPVEIVTRFIIIH